MMDTGIDPNVLDEIRELARKYDNFTSHLSILEKAEYEDLENEFIISGIIDKFFIQFELGWKVLKEYLKYEGNDVARTGSPREILKEAFTVYEFIDEKIWIPADES